MCILSNFLPHLWLQCENAAIQDPKTAIKVLLTRAEIYIESLIIEIYIVEKINTEDTAVPKIPILQQPS